MADDLTDLPPIPVFSIPQVFSTRDKLLDEVFYPDLGMELSGDLLHDTALRMRKVLKLGSELHPVMLDSLRPLVGRSLDLSAARDLCWRIAGNLNLLRGGVPVHPWTSQADLEWVPVQIRSSRFHLRKAFGGTGHEMGRMFRFRVLAGTSASLVTDRFWTPRMSGFMAKKLGFTSPRKKLFKRDDLELSGMRMLALVEPSLSQRSPGFRRFHCPGSMLAYNKKLIKLRRRIGFACPFSYDHECFQCPHGSSSCGAAVHPCDYEVRQCSGCGQEAYFDVDPLYINNYCINCQPRADSGLQLVRPVDAHQRAVLRLPSVEDFKASSQACVKDDRSSSQESQ